MFDVNVDNSPSLTTIVGNTSDDFFSLSGAYTSLKAFSLVGGAGQNVVAFKSTANNMLLTDATFQKFSNIVELDVNFGSSGTGKTNDVYLGPNAQQAGILFVRGQYENDQFDASQYTVGIKLSGDQGNDLLFGGSGNDELIGGPDTDQLEGGPGNDIFSYAQLANLTPTELVYGGTGRNTMDFSSAPSTAASALVYATTNRITNIQELILPTSGLGSVKVTQGTGLNTVQNFNTTIDQLGSTFAITGNHSWVSRPDGLSVQGQGEYFWHNSSANAVLTYWDDVTAARQSVVFVGLTAGHGSIAGIGTDLTISLV